MKEIIPLHEIKDIKKLETLIESMSKHEWQGRNILVIECGDYYQALTGSHRIIAAQHTQTEIPLTVIDVSKILEEEEIEVNDMLLNLEWTYNLLKKYNMKEEAELLLEDFRE